MAEIAARIRRAVREFDAVGRYGGEEFIAILSNCDLEAAKVVCERIRGFVANDPIVTVAGKLSATVSIGLAAYDPAHDVIEHIITVAGSTLYRAMGKGLNRVEI